MAKSFQVRDDLKELTAGGNGCGNCSEVSLNGVRNLCQDFGSACRISLSLLKGSLDKRGRLSQCWTLALAKVISIACFVDWCSVVNLVARAAARNCQELTHVLF